MNALELNTRLDDVIFILMEIRGESESIAETAIDELMYIKLGIQSQVRVEMHGKEHN